MKQFKGWHAVVKKLHKRADEQHVWLNDGQRASVRAIAERLPDNGLVIADEVGMGKTRIAVAVACCVQECGGRVAVLVPPGLGYQWQTECKDGGLTTPPLLRSLWSFLAAWHPDPAPRPWFTEQIVLISHAFANWRLGEHAEPWRWVLLPKMIAHWRKKTGKAGRFPHGYYTRKEFAASHVAWAESAADSITAHVQHMRGSAEHRLLDQMVHDVSWDATLFDPAAYAREPPQRTGLERAVGLGLLNTTQHPKPVGLRAWLECAVGLGLGAFDLIIVDEAHKGREQDGVLTRLLEHVVLPGTQPRRIGLTATPIELDASQWASLLGRLAVRKDQIETVMSQAIVPYMEAVRSLQQSWRSNPEVRTVFCAKARAFQDALSPYLLRRDKQEDEAVARFVHHAQSIRTDDYRRRTEVYIQPEDLPHAWRCALYVAEALSVVTRQEEDRGTQRLRLTLGNGHGISAWLDVLRDTELDPHFPLANAATEREPVSPQEQKRLERAEWWQRCLKAALDGQAGDLYAHPAILKAVEEIEHETARDEKVLVFGRFTKPMQALVKLLNAREMLRHLQDGRPWPQAKVYDDVKNSDASEWPAVRAAHRQLGRPLPLREINGRLEEQYHRLENDRERLRHHLFDVLTTGFKERGRTPEAATERLFNSFRKGGAGKAIVARILAEYLGRNTPEDGRPLDWANAFGEMICAVCNHDDFDDNGEVDEEQAEGLWADVVERLEQEYGSAQGRFARLMNGATPMPTRRLLQAAFNREHSFPRVLVAQSLVGREGLNLHQACRVVVLLHPEWNPGVVEQQIGRVDRVGSRWAQLCEKAATHPTLSDWPRIEIKAIVFSGTYDAHNWRVLKQRWDDLRAQLHGDVILDKPSSDDPEGQVVLQEIVKAAPQFSPWRSCGKNGRG